MESDEENALEEDEKYFVPERISLLVIISGFLIMLIGTIVTMDPVTVYFDVGIVLIFIGIFLFMIFIYSRIYVIEHIPVSVPESLHRLLSSFGTAEGTRTGAVAGYIQRTLSKPILLTRDREIPSTAPTHSPGLFSRRPTTASARTPQGIDLLEEVTSENPASGVKPVTTPDLVVARKRAVRVKPVTTPRPAPASPAGFVDVLEESDRELESFIDQLIEE